MSSVPYYCAGKGVHVGVGAARLYMPTLSLAEGQALPVPAN